ncbi:RHS repeat-associated core domain-containing protein [Microvirga sp. TS319]|uniref:RHS repeat-associated core domain-containing protein n=1 Tax=Microvirga sp. TS319 TaxID=3241165 RepID=UPI003519F1CB
MKGLEITGPASFDLRFPGQWFRLETGLAYNGHRHYDPSTGRYITPDPLDLHQDPQPSGPASSGDTVGENFRSWLQELGLQARPAPDQGRRVPRDGPSLYAYAGANPLQQTDPRGLQSITVTWGHGDRHVSNPMAARAEILQCLPNLGDAWGPFWGRTPNYEYRAYLRPNGILHIGTYYYK